MDERKEDEEERMCECGRRVGGANQRALISIWDSTQVTTAFLSNNPFFVSFLLVTVLQVGKKKRQVKKNNRHREDGRKDK